MALAFTSITGGTSETPGTSVTDGDTTTVPGSNRLVELDVYTVIEGAEEPNQPTVIGKGLTWVAINTVTFTDGATFNSRLTTFRGMAASPTADAIVITTTGQTQAVWLWECVQTPDVDTSGTNGSGAIVQAPSPGNSGTGTAASETLAAFGDATNNATRYTVAHGPGASAISPEAGMTGFTQRDTTSYSLRSIWRLGQDTSPSATIAASRTWGVVAHEVKAAAGGGGSTQPPRTMHQHRMRRAA